MWLDGFRWLWRLKNEGVAQIRVVCDMTEKWKPSLWEAQQRYKATQKGKDRDLKYEGTEKARERRKRYLANLTPEQRESRREQKRLCAERRRERDRQDKTPNNTEEK